MQTIIVFNTKSTSQTGNHFAVHGINVTQHDLGGLVAGRKMDPSELSYPSKFAVLTWQEASCKAVDMTTISAGNSSPLFNLNICPTSRCWLSVGTNLPSRITSYIVRLARASSPWRTLLKQSYMFFFKCWILKRHLITTYVIFITIFECR